jgi:hypothetical protein
VALRARVCGLPLALSVNERLPDATPPAVGVKVTATVQEPDAATGLDVEQVVPEAAIANGPETPIALKVRLALPVFVSVTVCAGLVVPTVSEGKVGGAGKLTTGPVPVPLKLTVCGLLPALSVNERLPEFVPTAVGVKVTVTAHEPDAATGLEVEQVVPEAAIAKGPVVPVAVNVRLALPVFVSVTVCDGLVVPTGSDGKVGGAGKPTMGPVPVPLKLNVCGLLLALSVNERLPETAPIAVGVNVTATVQEPEAGTRLEVEQVVPEVVIAKGPVVLIAVNVRLALPVFVTVTVCDGLVAPTGSDGKVSGADRLTTGPVPVPVKVTVCGLLPALSANERLPEFVPRAVGVKVTATVQEPEAATGLEVEHVVPEMAIAKGPVVLIAVNVRLALPVLVTVTFCAGLVVPTGSDGKVGGADRLTTGALVVPVPPKLNVCGLLLALSVSERLPEAAPTVVGVNVTATVQEPEAATGLEVEHVVPEVAIAKGPVVLIAVNVRLAFPVLATVTV